MDYGSRKMSWVRIACLGVIISTGLMAATVSNAFEATEAETRSFLAADVNKDLVLNRKEFRTFVQLMADAGQSTSKTIRAFGAYGYAFGIADRDKDGVVSPHELRAADDEYRASN